MSALSVFFRNFRNLFAEDQNHLHHELGSRHDRTESRLDFAEPRLDHSEQRLDTIESRADFAEKKIDATIDRMDKLSDEFSQIRDLIEKRLDKFEQTIDQRLEEYQLAIDKRIDERFSTFERLTDSRLASIETRIDVVTVKNDEQYAVLSQQLDQRASEFEYAIDDRLVHLDAAIDERMTNYENAVDTRFEDYTNSVDTRIEDRFANYSGEVDDRVDDRLQKLELRIDEQNSALNTQINQNFEQRTRAVDLRVDDRQLHLEQTLDQRLSAFEKGIDIRLFNREKYVDDRLVRIGDDIVARTDLLLQHSEQRLDQLRRALRALPEIGSGNGEKIDEHLQKYDRLTRARKDLADIVAQVNSHFDERPDQAKPHYFKIIEWKNEAVESLKKFNPDEQEVADYILSYVDCSNPKHVSYAETHLRRFISTLNRIPPPQKSTAKLLELGSCFFFTPAIRKYSGYAQIACADWYDGAEKKVEQREIKQITGTEVHQFETQLFNVETDRFPYQDYSFQVVLCCEMLEHLSHDPMHMFWEINRVLERDGLLLVTTPNITSVRSIEGVLTGYPPYLWMKYNLQDSAQQHYHEHTPETVKTFLTAAGFSIVEMETEDVWAKSNPATLELLKQLMFSPDLRGDNIFVLARKTGNPIERFPEALYVETETGPEPPPVQPSESTNRKNNKNKK